MADLISNGISALVANRANLATTSHNIANANTPGYSRQDTLLVTAGGQESGSGFIGNGVNVDGVRRLVNDFAVKELRITGATYNAVDRVFENAELLDNILGQESTGLSPILQRFFGAMQTAAEEPASVASRQVVLSESELLVSRVNSLYQSLESQNDSINTQLATYSAQVTSLSRGVADLNGRIAAFSGKGAGELPNDLLDEREYIVQQISELIDVSVIENDDRSIGLFVGNGQSIVVGTESYELITEEGQTDASRNDVVYRNGTTTQIVTNRVVSGKIGGLLEFRREILDETYNQLGLVSLGIGAAINDQHQLGMDLDGQIGGFFFKDVNETLLSRARAVANPGNLEPGTESIDVDIENISELTLSDYRLEFSSGIANQYSVTRLSDGEVVATNTFAGIFPATAEFDGIILTMNSGNFGPGDQFDIFVTRYASREMQLEVSSVRDIALAQPVRGIADQTNRGTGSITSVEVLDTTTSMFSDPGVMSPPLIIRFTSSSTYEVLDNSDPGNPVALIPPLTNLAFSPGVENDLLPANNNDTSLISNGSATGIATRNAVLGTYVNGFAAEDTVFTTIDPDTQIITRETYTSTVNASAQTTAGELDLLSGVTATARNEAVITNISSTTPMTFTFNGQIFNVSNASRLADDINANVILAASEISAISDGSSVKISSTQGIDFQFAIAGGATDTMDVSGVNGAGVSLVGTDPIPEVTLAGTVDLVLDEGVTLNGTGTLFTSIPTHYERFLGVQVSLNGSVVAGDTFVVEYNTNGFSDNRNAVVMGSLQTAALLLNGSSTLRDVYGNLVDFVGTKTSEAELGRNASDTLFERAKSEREAVSGVNIDEEAANVIRFEQAYNASAQLISVARTLFDTLLGAVR